ncbi:MAG TPA: Yip1 family protein [Ignavibacteria bacterium]|nr:hypothetical protein [Bacteroidota bacterium]HRI84214.1 Yip1 family protein [Ignavibacteria bacterium]HRJ99521.1 Yip1 family protein [Ignavibacteria bacterium]HRK00109.1 Yip1 family protein [Ignavibacteria bacterium]
MNEENIEPTLNQDQDFQDQQLTVTEAISGVISAPGETFETIASSPKRNYWLIPILIAVLLGIVTSFLFMQDKELTSRTMEKQKEQMMEKFRENIKNGSMTQEQADNAIDSMNPEGTMFKIIGYGGAALGPFIILFVLSVIYFIALKIFKSEAHLTDVMNVVGLSFIIIAVGNLLATVLSIIMGDLTSIGPAILTTKESAGKKIYAMLTKVDLFAIWFYTVVSIGLSRIGRIALVKTAAVVFGIWLIFYVIILSVLF